MADSATTLVSGEGVFLTVMRRWSCLRTAIAVGACLSPVAAQCQVTAASTRSQTRVLVLYALSRDAPEAIFPEPAPHYTVRERVYRSMLGDALGDQLEYYSELVNYHTFPDQSYESDFENYLVRKYGDRKIDLLIANGPDEATLAGRLQARLVSQPPIVFIGPGARRPVPKSTGHTYRYAMKESLDLALRMHPGTRHAFVVCGVSPNDAWYENEFRSQVPAPPPGVELTFLRGHFDHALTDRLAALPEHSIVFLVSLSSDGKGRRFRTASLSERLASVSNAPIYTWNGAVPGVFGGRLLSTGLAAERTSQLALRVLRGERPEDIPITTIDASVDALDWRQLDRWNVSEARVPAGVELRFRELGLFEQYRSYILGTLSLVVLQTLLIAGLLIQRRNRRRVERSLRESEERFRVMADTAPVMVWRSGPDQGCDFFNKPWLEFRGRRLRDELGDGWTQGVHPDDLQRCLTTYTGSWPGRESFRMEYRLQRADGEYRWVLDTGVPRLASDGTLLGYIGSCIDMTERRQAEEAVRANEAALRQSHAAIEDLAGRLITAQEAERARIARDLHDDISQKLAAISIAMSECTLPELHASGELLDVVTAVQQQIIDLVEDVRLLSHDLHPAALKHAGFVEALRSHCSEFARQQSLDVVVEANGNLAISDNATALCLYRVVQEALRNIAKHANARRVHVTLRLVGEEVRLSVADDGRGCEFAKAHAVAQGLGLRSMEERVRLAGGRLSIDSGPLTGTTVTVWVKVLAPSAREFAGV